MESLIAEILAAKQGDREFALFFFPGCEDDGEGWRAEIGNPCPAVMIGESVAEFRGEGETPVEALQALLANIRSDKRECMPDGSSVGC